MIEFFTAFAKLMPLESHINMLEKCVKNYKANPTDEDAKQRLILSCVTVAEAIMSKDKSLTESIKDNVDFQKWLELMPSKNQS